MKLLYSKKDNTCKVFLINSNNKLIIKKKYYEAHLKTKKQVENIFNEKSILELIKKFNIKNCNNIIDKNKDKEGPVLYLELINGCTLSYLLKKHYKLNKDFVKLIILQLINIIGDLHKNNIIYRDIKSSNILIKPNGEIFLIDFGLSKLLKKEDNFLTNSICGTPHSIAPEIWDNTPYSYSCDLYSLGVLIYELLIGEPPYGYKQNFNSIKEEFKNDIDLSFIDDEEKEILKVLLNKDKNQRNFFIKNLLDFNYFKDNTDISLDNTDIIKEKYKLCYYINTIEEYINNTYNLYNEEDKKKDIFEDF